MVDRFWDTMEDGRLIYIDDELIKWMGYSNMTPCDRKKILYSHCLENIIYGRDEYTGLLSGLKNWIKTYIHWHQQREDLLTLNI